MISSKESCFGIIVKNSFLLWLFYFRCYFVLLRGFANCFRPISCYLVSSQPISNIIVVGQQQSENLFLFLNYDQNICRLFIPFHSVKPNCLSYSPFMMSWEKIILLMCVILVDEIFEDNLVPFDLFLSICFQLFDLALGL